MKPILFNTEMVRAILEGRKTQKRIVVPEKILDAYYEYDDFVNTVGLGGIPYSRDYENEFFIARSRYKMGDILYVRETWAPFGIPQYLYKASDDGTAAKCGLKWRPSIHMPKEAARIFLRVKNVLAERLQDITFDDCVAEGIPQVHGMRSELKNWFEELWDSINAKRGYGWDANPWVWVYEFERVDKAEVRE